MSTVLNAAASYTGEAVLYGTLGLTYTDSTLNAAHTYSVQWVARKTRTAQAGNNTATVANGVLTGTLSFATTQGVRLFDSGGRNPLEGTLYIIDLTNGKTYLTEPLSIRWQPLPAGLTVTSVTTSQTFQSLADTPATYSGQAAKAAVVNAAEDGLTFTAVAVPGTTTPLALGAASAGSAATVSRVDHVHPTTGMATDTELSAHTGAANPHSGSASSTDLTTHTGGANPHSGSAASGANSDVTSLAGLTTPLSVAQGGTASANAGDARTALGAAASGANSDLTSLAGLTTPLSVAQGGTASANAGDARTALGVAIGSDVMAYAGGSALGNLGATPTLTLADGAEYTATYSADVTTWAGVSLPLFGSCTIFPLTNGATWTVAETGLTAAAGFSLDGIATTGAMLVLTNSGGTLYGAVSAP